MKKLLFILLIFLSCFGLAAQSVDTIPTQDVTQRLRIGKYPLLAEADSILVTNADKVVGYVPKALLEQTLAINGTVISISGDNLSTVDIGPLVGANSLWGNIGGTIQNQSDLIAFLNTKQNELVSGTNIRTINGFDILGSGDLVITATGGEANNLQESVTWANVPNANITQSSVKQHESSLSILESQITDIQHTPLADGSETIITAGTNATLSGTGTINDPYVFGVVAVNVFEEADETKLNSIETSATVGADWNTNLTNIPASIADGDNQALSITGQNLSISGGNTVTLPSGGTTDPEVVTFGKSVNEQNAGATARPQWSMIQRGFPTNGIPKLTFEYGNLFLSNGASTDFHDFDNALTVQPAGVSITRGAKTFNFTENYNTDSSVPTKADIDAVLAGIGATPQDLSLTGNTVNITGGTGVDLTPILGGGTTPAPENPNPELLLDYGAVSYAPHETLRTEYKGWTNLNDPTVISVFENTNGVGQIVEEVEGTGVGFYRRIRLETILNETYDIEVLMRVLEGTGQITTLGGTSPALNIQVPNGTEWVKYNFQLTDNNAFDGIILALRGYLGTGKFQYKVSQKLAN